MSSENKVALVISGGGSKGAFAVGVIDHLYAYYRDTGWFSIVGGSSVGGLISPLASLLGGPREIREEAHETLLDTFTNISTSDVLQKRRLSELIRRQQCLNESDPLDKLLHERLKQEWFDWLETDDAPYTYVVYTNYRSGKKLTASPKDANMDRESFIQAMRASASIPIYMEPAEVNGALCYDGGLRDPLPTERAIDLGADTMVPIIHALPEIKEKNDNFKGPRGILYRGVEILLDECRQNDLQLSELVCSAHGAKEELLDKFRDDKYALKKIKEVFEKDKYDNLYGNNRQLTRIVRGLQPDKEMTSDILTFEPEKMKQWMKWGQDKAKEVIDRSPFI